jgi:hypothetical protein
MNNEGLTTNPSRTDLQAAPRLTPLPRSRALSGLGFIRYRIRFHLPIVGNDGQAFDAAMYSRFARLLERLCGGWYEDTPVRGGWRHAGRRYEEVSRRFVSSVTRDRAERVRWLGATFIERRFKQLEAYVESEPIWSSLSEEASS